MWCHTVKSQRFAASVLLTKCKESQICDERASTFSLYMFLFQNTVSIWLCFQYWNTPFAMFFIIKRKLIIVFLYSSQQCKQLVCCQRLLLLLMWGYLYVFSINFLRKNIVSLHFVVHSSNHWIKNMNNSLYMYFKPVFSFTSSLFMPLTLLFHLVSNHSCFLFWQKCKLLLT